jgi:hypothetical protein
VLSRGKETIKLISGVDVRHLSFQIPVLRKLRLGLGWDKLPILDDILDVLGGDHRDVKYEK